MIRLYSNIGSVYAKQNNFEGALKNQFAAREISEQSGDKQGLIISNHNIGLVYSSHAERLMQDPAKSDSAVEKLAEALKYQYTALRFAEATGGKFDIASATIAIGTVLCRQASFLKLSKAKEKYTRKALNLEKGLVLAKEIGAKELIKDSYLALSDAYKGINDYKNAFVFEAQYIQMRDSLKNNETSKKIEQLRLTYEIEKAQGR